MNACWLSLTITPSYLDKLATNQEINRRALLKIIFQVMGNLGEFAPQENDWLFSMLVCM